MAKSIRSKAILAAALLASALVATADASPRGERRSCLHDCRAEGRECLAPLRDEIRLCRESECGDEADVVRARVNGVGAVRRVAVGSGRVARAGDARPSGRVPAPREERPNPHGPGRPMSAFNAGPGRSRPEEYLELSWEMFGELCRALALRVARDYKPEVVVGIARAGAIPGAVIASILRCEFHSMRITRKEGDRFLIKQAISVEIEGEDTPALVAEWLTMVVAG